MTNAKNSSKNVQVISRKMVKPSTPTPNHLRKFKLSLFDQMNPRVYTGSIYYYSSGGGATASGDRLEKSLSEALDHAYPFAGRLVEDELFIDCSDQGAEFCEARVRSKLSDLLERARDDIELLAKLFLPRGSLPTVYSPHTPLLAIQVTSLDDGGMVVGIWNSHILADGATTALFIKSWAEACRSSAGTSDNPYDYKFVADVFPAITSGDDIPQPPPPTVVDINNKIVVKSYKISSSKLLHLVTNGSGDRKPPSKVVATMALVWKTLIASSAAKNGYTRDSMLSVVMNLRGKVSLVGSHAFGNFITSANVKFVVDKDENKNPDLHDLAATIRTAVSVTSGKFAGASKDEVMKMYIKAREERRDSGCNDRYLCSSLLGAFPVYEVDFGWGEPAWVSLATAVPGVWLMDGGPGEDGIEVWVSLKQDEMHAFNAAFTANLASIDSQATKLVTLPSLI